MAATNIRRLQPLRILVVGHDRRFVRVTVFLLASRAYEVIEAEVGEALSAAERFRADVVVFDVGSSRGASGRLVAQLSALPSPPTVVLATSNGKQPWDGQASVAKWSPIDELVAVIENAALRPRFPSTAEAAQQ
jgi:CheY-like chemotaxis protein